MEVAKVLDGKYEIVKEIKRGGFGVIYLGRDRLFDKPIAVKAIAPELLGEAKYIDIFQAESLAVARLNHHNIVRIYDIKRSDDGQFYIIMEFVDGADLGKLIALNRKEPGSVPFHLGAYVVAETCAGLDYAHTRRDPDTHQPLFIVHQDVSPGNIMVNRLGEVKIIDFGLANARRRGLAGDGNKNEVLVQGKIAYIAPEQVNGTTGIDHRADIFSLGVVLHEVLTGRRLFKELVPEAAVERLRTGGWDMEALQSSGAPQALIRIVERATQRESAQRYQTANQMYLDLMNYLGKEAPAADHTQELGKLVRSITPDHEPVANGQARESNTEAFQEFTGAGFKMQNEPYSSSDETVILDAEAIEPVQESDDFMAQETRPYQQTGNGSTAEAEISVEPEEFVVESASSAQPQDVAFYKVLEEEEEEGELRTIIDVVRLSARSHKKAILLTLVGVLGVFLVFTGLDTIGRWTSWGQSVSDFLFPPAIRLVSFPPNAQVYLDDQPLPKTTPLAIERISPGVHKLTMTLPRFEPIVRSIQVPPKGEVSIAGESVPERNQPYIFRFKAILEITSVPSGAEVYLNGVKYTQATPCRVVWEVGDALQIEMHKAGMAPLQGFTLNTMEGVETIEDRRLWLFERIEEQREHYKVEGTFVKAVTITSNPSLAEIYIDGGETPVALTGYSEELLLANGVHTITLQKAGYLSKSFTATVDEVSPERYHEDLSRVVRVFAKDVADPGDNDIGARLIELVYNERRTRMRATTPCEVTLQPYTYKAILEKEGYETHTLVIHPNNTVAIARMAPEKLSVEIVVLDEKSGAPVEDVEVSFQPVSQTGPAAILFGNTDQNGTLQGNLGAGEYRFRVKKFGYRSAVKELRVTGQDKRKLIFKLLPVI